ncbi:unnamed protein product [Periconia digitata]|uniref:Uncharacterized protein n=1 Tax=Periconia digitata TaxID=1303443 RepID=A0A9W4ULB6_9PLEO|nr:unnamed protein product [Periconia digitata]
MSSATNKDNLEVYFHLKSLIISNAKLQHGASIGGRPRSYDIVTSSQLRGQKQYRVSLVAYDENQKGTGKVDIDSKVLSRSGMKLNLNGAMEDLLKKTQEELWKE